MVNLLRRTYTAVMTSGGGAAWIEAEIDDSYVIVGGRDPYAPLDELSALLEDLPNANLDVIPKADHFFASHGLAELVELVRSSVA